MRLYHGTSSRHLESILTHGLQPRGEGKSNWDAASSGEVVYLTKTYGLYFASHARKSIDEDMLIVEIDTDLLPSQEPLLADEDAITFAWQSGKLPPFGDENWLRTESLERQAMYFADFLRDYADIGCTAEWSVSVLGNCTHHGAIPPEAITRIISYEGKNGWWLAFHDPLITPANYRFCGSEYEATQLTVAGRLEEAKAIKHMLPMMISLDYVDQLCAEHRKSVLDLPVTLTPSV